MTGGNLYHHLNATDIIDSILYNKQLAAVGVMQEDCETVDTAKGLLIWHHQFPKWHQAQMEFGTGWYANQTGSETNPDEFRRTLTQNNTHPVQKEAKYIMYYVFYVFVLIVSG